MIRVTVWNEYRHEKSEEAIRAVYPNGIHDCIADFLGKNADMQVKTAVLDQPENGLTDEVLNNTDVLIWWGHMAHGEVLDATVEKVYQRVISGMGLIVLHSGHHSKIFRKLMGTTCNLKWRDDDKERLWAVMPAHPILAGLPEHIDLGDQEMYGEPFDIPTPDETLLLGWFAGGEVFRAGVTYRRGNGRIFYFQPGHESNPTYFIPEVQQIIVNAVRWANPTYWSEPNCPWFAKLPEM